MRLPFPERFRPYAAFYLLVVSVQILGGAATASAIMEWYPILAKPPHTPPDWLFAPVWTALYLMVAVAGARIWRCLTLAGTAQRLYHPAMQWYMVQLALNLGWSVVFFGLRSPEGGMVTIFALIVAILMNIQQCRKLDKLACGLLVPYLLWVVFAATLNLGIVVLN